MSNTTTATISTFSHFHEFWCNSWTNYRIPSKSGSLERSCNGHNETIRICPKHASTRCAIDDTLRYRLVSVAVVVAMRIHYLSSGCQCQMNSRTVRLDPSLKRGGDTIFQRCKPTSPCGDLSVTKGCCVVGVVLVVLWQNRAVTLYYGSLSTCSSF
jgi:hypothetical protein